MRVSQHPESPEPPLVSIVIPTYNHAKFVAAAIDSALGQTYAPIEIVVVDDGSTDRTPEIVQSYGYRVRYIRRENGGPGAALNTGIRRARGRWIAWLSSDDLFVRTKVERQLQVLSETPEAQIIYSDCYVMDEEARVFGTAIAGPYSFPRLLRVCFIYGGTVLFRRDVFDRVAPFDEDDRYGHDWDLLLRAAEAGCRFTYVAEPLYFVRCHPGQTSRNSEQLEVASRVVAVRHLRRAGVVGIPVLGKRMWDEARSSTWRLRNGGNVSDRLRLLLVTFRNLVR